MRRFASIAVIISLLTLGIMASGCAPVYNSPNAYQGGAVGAAVGATAGALIDEDNRWRGGAIGGGLGAIFGGALGGMSAPPARYYR